MKNSFDLAVIGGGVLGTFHAFHAIKSGLKVALFEKDNGPRGASARNFGQVVPSGMNSKWQAYGRESLRTYKEIQATFDISVREEGSVYLASDRDEVGLLEELHQINKSNGYPSLLMSKASCLQKYPGLRTDYVKAGLFFPQEIIIEPRIMIYRLLSYLEELGLHLFSDTHILECDALNNGVALQSANGNAYSARKVIICNGSEFKTLYPSLFKNSDLEVAKLQMMQTKPQANYKLRGSILTGLSIRRYEAFAECPSYWAIKKKENNHTLVKRWGIHILFKQAIDGSFILGDSHEYADAGDIDKLGFDINMDVDNLILEESKKIFELPNYEIQNRWVGFYSQSKNSDLFQQTVDKNIHIVTGIGGKGMTGSAGFAKENISKLFNLKHV